MSGSFTARGPEDGNGRGSQRASVPPWLWPASGGALLLIAIAVMLIGRGDVLANGGPTVGGSGFIETLQAEENMPQAELWRGFADDRLLAMGDQVCRPWEADDRPNTLAEVAGVDLFLATAWDDVIPPFSGASREAQIRNITWTALEHHCDAEAFEAASNMLDVSVEETLRQADELLGP